MDVGRREAEALGHQDAVDPSAGVLEGGLGLGGVLLQQEEMR